MAAIRHALRVEKKAMIGLTVLERTGASAYRGERMQLPDADLKMAIAGKP